LAHRLISLFTYFAPTELVRLRVERKRKIYGFFLSTLNFLLYTFHPYGL